MAISARSSRTAPAASAVRITNPIENEPVTARAWPSTFGRMKPPMPPIAPTTPVTRPISRAKRCGTIWNTAPLPRPRHSISTAMTATMTGSVGSVAQAA